METSLEVELGTPRIEDKREMRIAGLRGTFTPETMPAIVELRQRFGPRIGTIPGETGTRHSVWASTSAAANPSSNIWLALRLLIFQVFPTT